MKGLLRIYDDGETFKCRLNWAVIKENYLNFYEDKKVNNPSSFVNLSGCHVKKIFNETYNVNMIEITTSQNHVILLTPDNMKEYNKWNEQLYIASQTFRDSFKGQHLEFNARASRVITEMSEPRKKSRSQNQNPLHPSNNIDNNQQGSIVDNRGRNQESQPGHSNGYRRESSQPSSRKVPDKAYVDTNQRDSMSIYQKPVRDRRESSDIVGKRSSVVSLNYNAKRESNMPTLSEKHRSRAIETVKEDPMMGDEEILETKQIEELKKKYPITDKTKRWSIAATDLVGKSNDELFLMLIQLNREKAHMEIWKDTLEKYINEIDEKLQDRLSMQTVNELETTKTHYEEQLQNIEYLMNLAHPLISFMDAVVQMSDAYAGNNDAFHIVYHQVAPTGKEDFSNIDFIRHNQEKQIAKLINENNNQLSSYNNLFRDNGSDKENSPEVLLKLANSEGFLSRRTELNDVIDEISEQLKELEPSKLEIECYVDNMDNEYGFVLGKNSTLPLVTSKGSIINVKTLKDNESKINNSAFMPRRSTRKAPKSDMAASINRKEILKRQGSVGTRSKSASLRYPSNTTPDTLGINTNIARRSFNVNTAIERDAYVSPSMAAPVTPRSQKSKTSTMNFSDSIGRSSSSKVQNQLRDLMRTDPYEDKRPPSPIYRDRSSILSVQELQPGPLLKLNTGLFQNVHGPKRSVNNDNVVKEVKKERPLSRVSVSESDISIGSHRINQRLNLNQQFDDKKHWKNPSGNSQTPELSAPEKVNIGERYRSSIIDDEDINEQRSRKIRKMAANESFSRLTKEDGGRRNQRETQLLNNARLAQEASKRSREIQQA